MTIRASRAHSFSSTEVDAKDTRHALEQRLACGDTIREPVAVVVAHPDDEVLWLGTRLNILKCLRIIHLTDGAPRDLQDARRAGCGTWQEYASVRARELVCALDVLDVHPEQCLSHAVADQESGAHLVSITRRLTSELGVGTAVLTHAYEHGHPDHDSAAFAVHAACALLHRSGSPVPRIIEFASYHRRDGGLAAGLFWPHPDTTQYVLTATPAIRARKATALRCFNTQQQVISQFAPADERVRRAPSYDFAAPAPPTRALYDEFRWCIDSHGWREQARAALRQLGLSGPL